MTKPERIFLIGICARLNGALDALEQILSTTATNSTGCAIVMGNNHGNLIVLNHKGGVSND